MITQAELIQVVRRNIHLFQQQLQPEQNLIPSKLLIAATPTSIKQQKSPKITNHSINSRHQSINQNHNPDLSFKFQQQIPHKRRHKIFSLPSHNPKQQHTHNQQTQTIRPSPKNSTSSLYKHHKQTQCLNTEIGKVNINSSLKVHLQPNMKSVNKKLQLLSNDYLPSPSQLNAILKSISKQSRFVPDQSIQSRKSLRNKRQRASIHYHEAINYEPQKEFTKKFLHPNTYAMHPERIQISNIKFNYVDSKYYLER